MAFATKILPHYTYDDWVLWEGKWELYEGHPVAMSPSAVPRHQQVAAALMGELFYALKACNTCTVYDTIDIKISEDTILEPDVLVVCKDIKKKYLDFPPDLVVEILSPATALRDRHTKYELYEQFGIQYYIIIDAEKNEVEIYSLENDKYQLQRLPDDSTFAFKFSKGACNINIDFKEIW
jgi:Uma2 family endonuclease